MRDYAWMCLNLSEWLLFYLHLSIVIPYLKEPYTVLLESKNLIFFIVAGSIWFYLLFWAKYFFKLDFKSAVAFGGWADQGPRILPSNDIPSICIYDAFLMICLSILLLFIHNLVLWRRFAKAVILQYCKSVRESSR